MAERKRIVESKFGKEWILFGKDPGLKTQDLIDFSRQAPFGVQTLAGVGIGATLFDETLRLNNLAGNINGQDLLHCQLPTSMSRINRQVASLLPNGAPVVIRSSARDERGGTGVYYSGFMVPSGDLQKDIAELEQTERAVYASYYTNQAKAYRQGADSQGMALLVQPVIGDRFDNHFMPAFSGVMTMVDGKPTLRLVIGLGTKAVDMDEAIVLTGNDISINAISQRLGALEKADAINLSTGHVQSISITDKERERVYGQLSKLTLLFDAYRKNKQPFYWEFAIDEQNKLPFIVQAAPEQQKNVLKLEFDKPEGTILYEGKDIVNTGVKKGRGIFVVGAGQGYSSEDLHILEALNKASKNFLLVLPDTVFTKAGGYEQQIGLSHFSNASGVVEIQIPKVSYAMGIPITIDHTKNRGGTHFSELCKRKDILFLGVQPQDAEADISQLGKMTERFGSGSGFWDVDYKMTNTSSGGRVEIIGSAKLREYTAQQLYDWADELYPMASSLVDVIGEDDLVEAGNAFFTVLNDCVLKAQTGGRWDLLNFDPFRFVTQISKEKIPDLIIQIQTAQRNLGLLDSYVNYEQYRNYYPEEEFPFDAYLHKAVSLLTERLHT